jgi:hypothetical protein
MTTHTFLFDRSGPYLLKDPDANLDYTFDWTEWLDGDSISSAEVTVTGGTKGATSNTSTAVTVWVSGGTVGQTITVACKITTSAGRIDERSVRLKVQER